MQRALGAMCCSMSSLVKPRLILGPLPANLASLDVLVVHSGIWSDMKEYGVHLLTRVAAYIDLMAVQAHYFGDQWHFAFSVGFNPYHAGVLLAEDDLAVGTADFSFVLDAVDIQVALVADAVDVQVGMGVLVELGNDDLEVSVASDPADKPVAEVDVAHVEMGGIGGCRSRLGYVNSFSLEDVVSIDRTAFGY